MNDEICFLRPFLFNMAMFLGTSELLWVLIKQYMHKG